MNKLIYNLKRNKLKRALINKIGKITETDDEIICYVKKLKAISSNDESLIICTSIPNNYKEIAKNYNLNKKVTYIFDNINFDDKKVTILGFNDSNINIKNCTFNNNIYINLSGQCECKLEDTVINAENQAFIFGNNINLKNVKISNNTENKKLNISIVSYNQLSLVNSYIGELNKKTNVLINSSNKIDMHNSTISGDEITFESDTTDFDSKSLLIAENKFNLKTDDVNETKELSRRKIFRNKDFKEKKEIYNKRLDLLQILKEIKKECEKIISEKEEVSNDKIKKILKIK